MLLSMQKPASTLDLPTDIITEIFTYGFSIQDSFALRLASKHLILSITKALASNHLESIRFHATPLGLQRFDDFCAFPFGAYLTNISVGKCEWD
jgi:hypothetical protein